MVNGRTLLPAAQLRSSGEIHCPRHDAIDHEGSCRRTTTRSAEGRALCGRSQLGQTLTRKPPTSRVVFLQLTRPVQQTMTASHRVIDDCIRPMIGGIAGFSMAATIIASLMVWLSVDRLRANRLRWRKRRRYAALAGLILTGVAVSIWGGHAAASEPVLVSGKLNLGYALGLAVLSLWLGFLAFRGRKSGPIQSAVLSCYGAAILIGTMSGWTWRVFQPCKHHDPTAAAEAPKSSQKGAVLRRLSSYSPHN